MTSKEYKNLNVYLYIISTFKRNLKSAMKLKYNEINTLGYLNNHKIIKEVSSIINCDISAHGLYNNSYIMRLNKTIYVIDVSSNGFNQHNNSNMIFDITRLILSFLEVKNIHPRNLYSKIVLNDNLWAAIYLESDETDKKIFCF